MNDEKEKYIHIFGRGGVGFALWLQGRLGGNEKCIIVDCSPDYTLIWFVWRKHMKNKILQAEKWVTNFNEYEKVIFYHEQEDWFTDSYLGVGFFFVTRRDDIPYINSVVFKMTDGRLRLLETTLIPQLKGGQNFFVMSIYDGYMMDESYVPRFMFYKGLDKEKSFSNIFDRGTRLWHV